MGFELKIKGQYLDLPSGTQLSLEQVNRILDLGDAWEGEYSLPITLPLTDKNLTLLQLPQHHATPKNTAGIVADLEIDGIAYARGYVKLEKQRGHYNFPLRGSISVYYTFKLGAFWQLIKDKTLRNINYGDPPSFVWKGFNVSGPNTGFIGHVTSVMNESDPEVYNYVFAPVLNNAGLTNQDSADTIINCCAPIGSTVIPTRFTPDVNSGTAKVYYNQYSPFPYIKFILERMAKTFKWNIVGDPANNPLEDPIFRRMVYIHAGAIGYNLNAGVDAATMSWDFAEMLPKLGLGNFIKSLANKLGWWFDFDDQNRVIRISYRKQWLTTRVKKDFTGKTTAVYESSITSGKVYRLQQANAAVKLDFDYLEYQGSIENQYSLPAASTAIINHCYLIKSENAYYSCVLNSSGNPEWQKSGDNVFDYTPTDSTDTISTGVMLPGSAFLPLRNTSLTELPVKMIIPNVSLTSDDTEASSFYLGIYWGLQQTINNAAGTNYNFPMISTAPYAPDGTKIGDYSLSYEFDAGANVELGIYELFWKKFLAFILQKETITVDMLFDVNDVLNFQYQDTILIRNSEYLVSKISFRLPLKFMATAELIRVV